MAISEKNLIGYFLEVEILIRNFGNKTNYVGHYGNLQLYLSLGVKLTKIHKVLKFKPTYITHQIFGKDYASIHEIKPVVILKTPLYVRFTVPDLSKWKMYDFHYNFLKNNFDAGLLFTDTDSLANEIKSENVYEEFFIWKDLFDFSNYLKDSKFFDETNKKVIGKMKDDFSGVIVIEFVGLKSKMYSMKKIDGKESNTAKE